MKKVNLLAVDSSFKRDLSVRATVTPEDKILSRQFGKDYFDGDRRVGYGGYYYDGRWVGISERAIQLFDLSPGDRVLDIGCGKGFFVYDLVKSFQIDAYGLDISTYALKEATLEIQGRLQRHDMRAQLNFPDDFFDAVFCINTLHNLDRLEASFSVSEMIRVVKKKENIFIQVDSYKNPEDLEIFEKWVLTAKLYMPPDDWLEFLADCGYKGAYYWTVLLGDGSVE